jgi:hypothetical protein
LAPPNYFFSIWPPQSLKAGSAPACWCVAFTRQQLQLAYAVLYCLLYLFCIYGISVLCILFVFSAIVIQSVFRSSGLYVHLETTLTDGLGSWHPCQASLGSHLQKHCLRLLSFLVFFCFSSYSARV